MKCSEDTQQHSHTYKDSLAGGHGNLFKCAHTEPQNQYILLDVNRSKRTSRHVHRHAHNLFVEIVKVQSGKQTDVLSHVHLT